MISDKASIYIMQGNQITATKINALTSIIIHSKCNTKCKTYMERYTCHKWQKYQHQIKKTRSLITSQLCYKKRFMKAASELCR
jgi:hypothetical protein